ncbi:hypothetical protein M378DRAFT_126966 [Amanita muscaria Koide BX008]|uniref:Protein arginine methyltransferase NDUFAF7 n=1 Tax=Amanita muscaria (strain Koide BX008) TaxID=946122 RepID=A0A0C2X6B8_AMAMK|nr:hypothetical protein M378DRAFT_126966 [Amanita muscaria Koide BX008]
MSFCSRLPRVAVHPTRFRSSKWLQSHRLSSTSVPQMTRVEKIILDNIKATGPIPFSTYMQLCLTHHSDGYYTNPSNPVFGTRGDFITSPEISQVFGELVGIWLLSQWVSAGRPSAVRLIELGPGLGTLMDDVLRVMSQLTSSGSPLKHLHLVESSSAMRSIQEQKLRPHVQKSGFQVSWHNTLEEFSPSPGVFTMLVAHEFFDALPIHVLQKKETGWHEVMIGSHDSVRPTSVSPTESSYPRLRRVLSPEPSAASTLLGLSSPRFKNLPADSTIEVSPSSFKVAHRIGQLLASQGESTSVQGGCALIIDYGDDKVYGDSFRAFKNHKIIDVFDSPGECDLTANVDFAYIKEAIRDLPGVHTHGPLSQADFLERMGLTLRVAALARAAPSEERRGTIRDAARRLVDRTGMGSQYQVLGITNAAEQVTWPFVKATEPEVIGKV